MGSTIKRFKITFFLLFFCAEGLLAQGVNFNRLSVEDGLQNNIVFSVTQDRKGFMWFGTMTGIDRYDGSEFVHYKVPDFIRKRDVFQIENMLCET